MANGRYFLHELPHSAWSWKTSHIAQLLNTPGVHKLVGHMCSHDMFVETPEGKKLAYKPTGWMSNSIHIP